MIVHIRMRGHFAKIFENTLIICGHICIFCFGFVGLCLLKNFCLPWTLRTMSNLGLGVHLHNTTLLSLLGFSNLSRIFQIFVIMPYLSILCLLRLCFTWSSEELCIFAIVWFRLTSCHLGCHWTKCVNLFLIMLGWIINFA